MPVHAPGRRHGERLRRRVLALLNLTAFVDMMTMLVVFLLMTFVATEEICPEKNRIHLPDARSQRELQRAPIITLGRGEIRFNGESIGDADLLRERLTVERARSQGGLIILQADRTTDAELVKRVLGAAHAAHYRDVMLAVSQRR